MSYKIPIIFGNRQCSKSAIANRRFSKLPIANRKLNSGLQPPEKPDQGFFTANTQVHWKSAQWQCRPGHRKPIGPFRNFRRRELPSRVPQPFQSRVHCPVGGRGREADESAFWLELILESDLAPKEKAEPLLKEANELVAIMAASRKSAKARKWKIFLIVDCQLPIRLKICSPQLSQSSFFFVFQSAIDNRKSAIT